MLRGTPDALLQNVHHVPKSARPRGEAPEAQGPQGGDDDNAMQDGNGDMSEDAEELEQDITDSSVRFVLYPSLLL